MALDDDLMFIAEESGLECYNGSPVLNLAIYFEDQDGNAYPFAGYSSAYMNIYQSRGQTQLKGFTSQLTRNSNVIVLNMSASDMTFNDNGDYYYEIGYVQSGGYSIPLRYGKFSVI
jgi:hypothetical protein